MANAERPIIVAIEEHENGPVVLRERRRVNNDALADESLEDSGR